MTLLERIEHFTSAFWAGLGAAVAGGFVWLFRTIFTNQRMINNLVAEQKAREEARSVDHEALNEIRTDLREVKRDVRMLWEKSRD